MVPLPTNCGRRRRRRRRPECYCCLRRRRPCLSSPPSVRPSVVTAAARPCRRDLQLLFVRSESQGGKAASEQECLFVRSVPLSLLQFQILHGPSSVRRSIYSERASERLTRAERTNERTNERTLARCPAALARTLRRKSSIERSVGRAR